MEPWLHAMILSCSTSLMLAKIASSFFRQKSHSHCLEGHVLVPNADRKAIDRRCHHLRQHVYL
ncbi:hypothetical protein FA10DRAFT_270247, partial [Acaromyces ingoldii]